MDVDVVIVGAGPVGLCLARRLSGHGLSIVLLDSQDRQALAEPAFDGREIALTHRSRAILDALGIWPLLSPVEISPLRQARVSDPGVASELCIGAGERDLGWLVPNHLIRQAAFRAVADCADVSLWPGVAAQNLHSTDAGVTVTTSDGRRVHARLLVAADSRFSHTRRLLGIGARSQDFGKTMLVCRIQHEHDHQHIARECFGRGQTLALLPLNGRCSSVVLTLPPRQIDELLALDDVAFCAELERRSERRLGCLSAPGSRHVYPLVGVYADRFIAPRAALVGDAAVGMHPVTAHGFNLGLLSQTRLADEVLAAARHGRDLADPAALARYQRGHRLATRPLYLATGLIVGLYTDDRAQARLLRGAALRAAQSLAPFRRALANRLMHA